jgi:hypothetical protein
MEPDEAAILARLDRLGALLFARDPTVVDELWTDLGFRLVGSELGERAETRAALATLIAGLFARPMRLSWAWRTREVTRHGEVAWLIAEGDLVATYPDRQARSPYRAVCVLQKVGERWHWRLFCGSEPASAV